MVCAVTVWVCPSKSKSLVNTFPETGVLINVLLISSIAYVLFGILVIVHVGHVGSTGHVAHGFGSGTGSVDVAVTFGPTGVVPVAVA